MAAGYLATELASYKVARSVSQFTYWRDWRDGRDWRDWRALQATQVPPVAHRLAGPGTLSL